MKQFGVTEQQAKILDEVLVKPLIASGCSIFAFSSRARGDYHQFSDLDVLVEGSIEQSVLSQIMEALEESSIPFRVDIVRLGDLTESYQEGVLQNMVKLCVPLVQGCFSSN
jgi:predicted nucleotidyltransferase